jgi:predicted Zn-dependent protease
MNTSRFSNPLNEETGSLTPPERFAAAENNARIARDDPPPFKMADWYGQAETVNEVIGMLKAGHAQQALIELKEAIELTPNDSPWYVPMVETATLLEAGRVLDAKVRLHKAVAELNPNSTYPGGRW